MNIDFYTDQAHTILYSGDLLTISYPDEYIQINMDKVGEAQVYLAV